MAYAQLTWREFLRDIGPLSANPTKLYAMGPRQAVRRTTLADAKELHETHKTRDQLQAARQAFLTCGARRS